MNLYGVKPTKGEKSKWIVIFERKVVVEGFYISAMNSWITEMNLRNSLLKLDARQMAT